MVRETREKIRKTSVRERNPYNVEVLDHATRMRIHHLQIMEGFRYPKQIRAPTRVMVKNEVKKATVIYHNSSPYRFFRTRCMRFSPLLAKYRNEIDFTNYGVHDLVKYFNPIKVGVRRVISNEERRKIKEKGHFVRVRNHLHTHARDYYVLYDNLFEVVLYLFAKEMREKYELIFSIVKNLEEGMLDEALPQPLVKALKKLFETKAPTFRLPSLQFQDGAANEKFMPYNDVNEVDDDEDDDVVVDEDDDDDDDDEPNLSELLKTNRVLNAVSDNLDTFAEMKKAMDRAIECMEETSN